jgi:hypothetical protein
VRGIGLGSAHDGVLVVTVCVVYAHRGAYGYVRRLVRGERASGCQQSSPLLREVMGSQRGDWQSERGARSPGMRG